MTTPTSINSGSGLTIPEEARQAAQRDPVVWKYITNRATADAVVQAVIAAAAPLIVAAELERLAEQFDQLSDFGAADLLRGRADELLGGPAELRVSGVSADGGEKQS